MASRSWRSTVATSSKKSSVIPADLIALTPGGRYSKDIEGLRPLAEELVKGGYRVLLRDRPELRKVRPAVLRPERIPHARGDVCTP